jgi:hypothetical protein
MPRQSNIQGTMHHFYNNSYPLLTLKMQIKKLNLYYYFYGIAKTIIPKLK